MRFYLYWGLVTLILGQVGACLYVGILMLNRLGWIEREIRQMHAVVSKIDRVLTGVKDEG